MNVSNTGTALTKLLSRAGADQLLKPLGMKIGSWNQLTSLYPDTVMHLAYSPPSSAFELYIVAYRLSDWIISGEWTLLQVDNSTAPMDDEIRVFEKVVLAGDYEWQIGIDTSFLFQGESNTRRQAVQTTLTLLIQFSLLFGWHACITSEASLHGRRLALQDGVVYFFGDANVIETAQCLVKSLTANPKSIFV